MVVSQPGVTATDYKGKHSSPHLRRWTSGEDKRIRSSFTVTDVLGEVDTSALIGTLEKRCGAGTLKVDASSEWSVKLKVYDTGTLALDSIFLGTMANKGTIQLVCSTSSTTCAPES